MAKSKSSNIESYTIKNGEKRYQFQLYIGTNPLTGKQQRTTRRGFKTLKEAKLEFARLKLEVDQGTFNKIIAETYNDTYNLWVVQYEKTVEESTFIKTIRIFKNHILPTLGEYKIDKLNVELCQRAVNEWADKLKNFKMVKAYASKIVDFAIKRNYTKSNPFTLIELPKKRVQNAQQKFENFYTKDELIEFLSRLEKEDNYKAFTFFRLLSYTGMRKGEALALTWKDIDFDNQELFITKAIARGKDNKLYIKSTKTGTSRTIKIDEETLSILDTWRKKQQKHYLILGFNTNNPDQLIFSNTSNEYLQPTKTRQWILQIQEKYILKKVTTHGLRHTHCSLLFEAGVSIKEVQDRLGHSDVKTTMDIYAHVSEKAKAEAIQKFETYLNK
ncbi:site-specific integrase [Bacillus thuringiensis serovar nigeriensis]|uniref:tyrosine-type recombinase/integrase n=1 Tax=Bacillus thuringiensis TaxID=1428 RepID=UPI000A3AA480|nr:tyrosine-type recombinase/integrase [Bacillus thuringiensis]MEC3429708.1 tyrosine-type recombinase/integrase [Bacillus cereus]MRC98931.1 tyrosine-type recombinase/integrase [Bacillus thuringiensis]OTX19281.1 site-specific integrase [Bacillus thuringiensis serovar nigeriensis]